MPNRSELAIKTELSRQTIYKHLSDFESHPLYLEQIEEFKLMKGKVLARVFQYAVNGDVSAAKLYFKVMGTFESKHPVQSTIIQNQNNYIQINQTIVNQEVLECLDSEQLNRIETIINSSMGSK